MQVLLLDEVTVDMDVVGRLDLLAFFRQECTQRGAIIIYATHIFDGLEDWVTHVVYIHNGRLVKGAPCRMPAPVALHLINSTASHLAHSVCARVPDMT